MRYLIYVSSYGVSDLRAEIADEFDLLTAIERVAKEELDLRRRNPLTTKPLFQVKAFEVETGIFDTTLDFDATKSDEENRYGDND